MQWFAGSQLKSKDPHQRIQAITRLMDARNPHAMNAVLAAVGDPVVGVRLEALRVILGWRDDNVIRVLKHVLQDPDSTVRERAIVELAKLGARESIPDVLPFLCDSSMPVRTAAVHALSVLGWRAETVGEQALQFIGRSEFAKAAALGHIALELLLPFVAHPVVLTRQEVAQALGALSDPEAATALRKLLTDPDAGVRIAAIQSIRRVQPSPAVLATMLEDADENVRIAAVEALGQLRDNEAVPILLNCLRDTHWGVRCAAAAALAALGERSTVPLLVDSLRDSDPDMRVAAAEAIGTIGGVEAIEPLILAQLDPETSVRQAALKAIVRVDCRWYRNPRAFGTLPALKRAVRADNHAVRNWATELMERIFGIRRQSLRSSSTDPEADRRAQAAEVLISCLWDDEPLVVGAAAETLGLLRSRRAIDILKVKAEDEHPWVRKQALAAALLIDGGATAGGWQPSSTAAVAATS